MEGFYERQKGNSFIHIVEVNKSEGSGTISEAVSYGGKSFSVGPAGKRGHNVMFSTTQTLEIIVDSLSAFFHPESYVSAADDEVEYFDDNGNLRIKLKELTKKN